MSSEHSTAGLRANSSSSKRRRELLAERLEELQRELPQSHIDQHEGLSGSTIARALFAKAPSEFLERKTAVELSSITAGCEEAVRQVSEGAHPIVVRSTQLANYTAFTVALKDRPFVVNSIAEALRNQGVAMRVFLHPILTGEQGRISLSYLEVALLTDDDASRIQGVLIEMLEDLTRVTDDFSPLLVQTETLARLNQSSRYASGGARADQEEIGDFLRWLVDRNFVFMGHAEWRLEDEHNLAERSTNLLGVFRSDRAYVAALMEECRQDAIELAQSGDAIAIKKLNTESPVHRIRKINHIAVQERAADGKTIAVHSLIGIFSSKAHGQESSSIPLIRRKLERLILTEDVVENSHDYKNIVDVIDRMPKEEAFRLDVEELRELVHAVLDVQHVGDTRVHTRVEADGRSLSVLVVIPRERFSTATRLMLQSYLESLFEAPRGSSQFHLDVSNKPHARMYFYVPVGHPQTLDVDVERMQGEIIAMCRSWSEQLVWTLQHSQILPTPDDLVTRYENAFSEEYQALNSVEDCELDIRAIEGLSPTRRIIVSLQYRRAGDEQEGSRAATAVPETFTLVVYSYGEDLTVSRAVPLFENAGLEVLSEQSFQVLPRDRERVFISRFLVRNQSGSPLKPVQFDSIFAPGLERVIDGSAGNDPLNALMLSAGLTSDRISILRAYCYLLWQIDKPATRSTLFTTLAGVPQAALKLWEMFEVRFDPSLDLTIEQRQERFEALTEEFHTSLRGVSDIIGDKILRSLHMLLANTVRTNAFQKRDGGVNDCVAFKIRSELVEVMPQPRPKFEIFVYSPRIEGVHLRSGVVARGGIRWSDRPEDFRSEVLGLMKTQTIKNVVIVPTGAKGGFIVKNLPSDPAQLPRAVEAGYAEYVRSLLSITDNRVDGEIVPPPDVVRHDEDDPYLVVAADKGTATFSDLANRIATEEFGFWLGDAFASGGSNGYDHKLYGITARGAWECVKRHFSNAGIDYLQQPFTVVGIGDMSGDVFGNGLLMSDKMKLIAAFNHKHIFIDPNPDPAVSFEERARLFKLPRSQWSDYDPSKMSDGGGVYNRFAKEITLSPQARLALGIPDSVPNTLNGEQLIHHILQAPCDLLWNGGIGTYVKSPSETNPEVRDSANDLVRVNSDQLRARVVGEGGNLGFTQSARIDFALRGGFINTDAIDNSGGVDLSDHEVNLKVLFSGLLQQERITLEDRNATLRAMASDVVEGVLDHNRGHALLLTVAERRSRHTIEYYQSLIRHLARSGYLNRSLEALPDDEELEDRQRRGVGLTRPELAVVSAGVKMWIKETVVESALAQDPLLEGFLTSYFPEEVLRRFKDAVLNHPLAPHIIATQVTNTLLEEVGVTFIHRASAVHSMAPQQVVHAALCAHLLLDVEYLTREMARLDTITNAEAFITLRHHLWSAMQATTVWFLGYRGTSTVIGEVVTPYLEPFDTLLKRAEDLLGEGQREMFLERLQQYRGHGLEERAARTVALFPWITPCLEMLWCARQSDQSVELAGRIFTRATEDLRASVLLRSDAQPLPRSRWEAEMLASANEDIRRSLSLLTVGLLRQGVTNEGQVLPTLQKLPGFEQLQSSLEEVRSKIADVAILAVVARKLRALASA